MRGRLVDEDPITDSKSGDREGLFRRRVQDNQRGRQRDADEFQLVRVAFRKNVSGSHVLTLDQCHVIRADEEVAVSVVIERTPA